MFKMISPASLFILSSFIAAARCQSRQCYTPNGKPDDSAPCNIAATESACCTYDSICLSNNFCLDPAVNAIYRGGCTDKTWESAECALYCTTVFQDGGCSVGPTPDGNSFCCASSWNGSDCEVPNVNSYTPFTVARGDIINDRTNGSTSPNATDTANSSNTSCSTASTVTVTTLAEKAGSSHELAVGLGVGLPLGIALVAALFLLWKQSKSYTRTAVREHEDQPLPLQKHEKQSSQVKPKHELFVQPVSELGTGS